MATVYVLYSRKLDSFYIGSCNDISIRLAEHNQGKFSSSYTSKTDDWELYYSKSELEHGQALKIESHLKRMKSRTYLKNLLKYPEIMEKLTAKYSAGSSR